MPLLVCATPRAILTPDQDARLRRLERLRSGLRIGIEDVQERVFGLMGAVNTELNAPVGGEPAATGPQTLYPVADTTTTDWVIAAGGGSNFYDKMDDHPANDGASTYIRSPYNRAATLEGIWELGRLDGQPVVDPGIHTGHVMHCEFRSEPLPDTADGIFTTNITSSVSAILRQNTTVIRNSGANDVSHTAWTDIASGTLSEAQAANITDYNDLNMRLVVQITGDVAVAVPISDTQAGSWSPSSGSDLYAMIDEQSSDGDTTYIVAVGSTSTDGIVDISPNMPVPGLKDCSVIVIARKTDGAGAGTLTVRLKEGSTTRKEISHVCGTSYNTEAAGTYALSEAEFDSISDWGDLHFEVAGTMSMPPQSIRVTVLRLKFRLAQSVWVTRCALDLPA